MAAQPFISVAFVPEQLSSRLELLLRLDKPSRAAYLEGGIAPCGLPHCWKARRARKRGIYAEGACNGWFDQIFAQVVKGRHEFGLAGDAIWTAHTSNPESQIAARQIEQTLELVERACSGELVKLRRSPGPRI